MLALLTCLKLRRMTDHADSAQDTDSLDIWVREQVKQAPPLSTEQRHQLAMILAPARPGRLP